jgi:hypothetical protein
MEIKLSKSGLKDLDRIVRRFTDAQAKVARTKHTIQYTWQLELLNKYAEVVKFAMGSVKLGSEGVPARGGYPVIDFNGSGGQTKYWKNLHPLTIQAQARRKYGFKGSASEAYDEYKWDFKIWNDTGETERSVAVHNVLPFAGIMGGSSTSTKANLNEEGGGTTINGRPVEVPARPLFMVANQLLLQYFKSQTSNPTIPLYQQIIGEFVKKTLRWGGKVWQVKGGEE